MVPTFDANPPVHMDTGTVFFDSAPASGGGRKGSMIQLALRLTERTLAGLKTFAMSVMTGLTGNASFPTPNPTPANIETAVDNLSDAEDELAAAEAVVVSKREAVEGRAEDLRNVLRAVAANCQDKVKNDPEELARTKLMSANLPIKTGASPVDPVSRPANFHVSQGDHSGEVDGGCNRVANAKMYRVRYGAAPGGPFETKYEGGKSSFTISGLPVGVGWLQMAAFGTNGGWSEWSDPATIHVV